MSFGTKTYESEAKNELKDFDHRKKTSNRDIFVYLKEERKRRGRATSGDMSVRSPTPSLLEVDMNKTPNKTSISLNFSMKLVESY